MHLKKKWFLPLLSAAIVLSLFMLNLSTVQYAHASLPQGLPDPPWYIDTQGQPHAASTCDDANYYSPTVPRPHAFQLGTVYRNVYACGPEPHEVNTKDNLVTFGGGAQEQEFECTELATRYMYLAYGTKPYVAGGWKIVSNYKWSRDGGLPLKVVKNNSAIPPKPGDVLSFGISAQGHTAVVIDTSNMAPGGGGYITVMDQNGIKVSQGGNGSANLNVGPNYNVDGSSDGGTVTGWLTPETWSIRSSPHPGSNISLQAVASTAKTDVWAVGYSFSTAAAAIAIHWNGSAWGSNTVPGSYQNSYLLGVSEISSTNILAVGYIQPSGSTTSTFALLGNGATWSTIPTDNPGTNAVLMGVGNDAAGDAWAVGNTTESGTTHPLIEQYQGSTSGFKAWNDPLPNVPGSTDNQLYGVTVSSSTEAYAVGSYRDANNTKQPLMYHWNGTMWSQVDVSALVPSGALESALNGVVEVYSTFRKINEVTAVGYYYDANAHRKTFTIRDGFKNYNDSSPSWYAPVTLSPSLSGDDDLYAVAAGNENDVLAVGISRGPINAQYYNPLILQWTGTSWQQLDANSAGTNVGNYLYGVVTAGNQAWAVGSYYNGTFSSTLTQRLS